MYLYLLEQAESGILYIGVTENVERRLFEHNTKTKHFTGKVEGVWKIVGIKDYTTNLAYKEERRLKKAKNKSYVRWYFLNSKASDHSSIGRASPS